MSNSFNLIPCPFCGQVFALEQAWEDVDGRRFIALITALPAPVIKPLYRYFKLFKPEKQALRWSRVLKLAQELAPMIDAAEVKRNGISYVVPVAAWENALNNLVENTPPSLKLPLAKNAYLLSILANEAEKGAAIKEKNVDKQRSERTRTREGAQKGMQGAAKLFKPPPAKSKSKPPANWRGESFPTKKSRDA